jgi:hypothetical protein
MSVLPVGILSAALENYPTRHFRGQKKEAPPLLVSHSRSSSSDSVSAADDRFGIVSQNTYPQALTSLSWLSYSPSGV